MKTAFNRVRTLSLNGLIVLCLLFNLVSCQKEKADTSDLLATVPSSASAVVGINLRSLLEHVGCKVSDKGVEPGKELKKIMESNKNLPSTISQIINIAFTGESGVSPSGAIVFYDAYNGYATFALQDVDKFRQFIEKETGSSFSDKGNGVFVCDKVAVRGAQAWVCLTSYNTIDEKAILAYSSLSSSQSFLQKDIASSIAEMEHDFVGWCQLGMLLKDVFLFHSFQDRAYVGLIMNFIFEDPDSINLFGDFLEGRFTMNVSVLNTKGKLAKYLLPSDKIDQEIVNSIGSESDLLIAAAIPNSFVTKLSQNGKSLLGSAFTPMLEALKCVDGTFALAVGGENDKSVSGVVQTDGKPNLTFLTLISNMLAPTRNDGKNVRFSQGTLSGALNISQTSDLFKNAMVGACVSENHPASSFSPAVKSMALTVSPKSGSLETEIIVLAKDAKVNILQSLLKEGVNFKPVPEEMAAIGLPETADED